MKANAPEKIYYAPYGDMRENHPITDNDIEYVRIDAFIEKAYNYLKNYAFVDDDKNVHLPTLLHDFLKDSRTF